jgi:hypothetical protein
MRRTALLGALAAAVLAVPAVTASVPAPAGGAAADRPDPAAPPAPAPAGPASTASTADAPAAAPVPAGPAAAPPPIVTAEGFHVAPGSEAVGSGPLLRYTVEVDPATGLDPADVAAVAGAALGDDRSWARDRRLVRDDDPTAVDARLLVAPPDVVDSLCAEAGLNTSGVYSCWNGRFVALNGMRWELGAEGFPDLTAYRIYLLNHEVGHGLGLGHVGCPGEGALAPLMMQQSKGLDGCLANGWPYP